MLLEVGYEGLGQYPVSNEEARKITITDVEGGVMQAGGVDECGADVVKCFAFANVVLGVHRSKKTCFYWILRQIAVRFLTIDSQVAFHPSKSGSSPLDFCDLLWEALPICATV
jgi:hypothetical protein